MVSEIRSLIETNRGLYIRLPSRYIAQNGLRPREIVQCDYDGKNLNITPIKNKRDSGGHLPQKSVNPHDTDTNGLGVSEEHGKHIKG
jgi:hypothetical protein